jgi:hypothetical protein
MIIYVLGIYIAGLLALSRRKTAAFDKFIQKGSGAL